MRLWSSMAACILLGMLANPQSSSAHGAQSGPAALPAVHALPPQIVARQPRVRGPGFAQASRADLAGRQHALRRFRRGFGFGVYAPGLGGPGWDPAAGYAQSAEADPYGPVGLPPMPIPPPPCLPPPLIIKVGPGLYHSARTRVLYGPPTCGVP